MKKQIQKIEPQEIEAESFRIIKEELGPNDFSEEQFAVVQRVIHATGDFSFADNLRFNANAIQVGIEAIKAGKDILTDVWMAASGINKGLLSKWGGTVHCKISDADIAAAAKQHGTTRAEASMDQGLTDNVGIVVIGNAPTALLRVMKLMENGGQSSTPDLIIGVPVGFVNAAESKDILAEKPYPFITALGRKGGSPVAASITNALLRLAAAQ